MAQTVFDIRTREKLHRLPADAARIVVDGGFAHALTSTGALIAHWPEAERRARYSFADTGWPGPIGWFRSVDGR